MPRQTAGERETAKRYYLESGGTILLKEIASRLGVPPSTVSSWKKMDKWDSFLKQKPRVNRAKQGNKNAAKPHPSQKDNKNPLRHGRYEKLKYETMTDEEKSLMDEVRAATDQIRMQMDLIAELEVRERRMYARIEALRIAAEEDEEQLVTSSAALEAYRTAEGKRAAERESKSRRHVTGLIQEIENALTAVQKQKQQAILTLHRLTEDMNLREREQRRLELEERRVALLEKRLALSDPDIESDAMKEAKRLLEGIDSAF